MNISIDGVIVKYNRKDLKPKVENFKYLQQFRFFIKMYLIWSSLQHLQSSKIYCKVFLFHFASTPSSNKVRNNFHFPQQNSKENIALKKIDNFANINFVKYACESIAKSD